MSAGLEQAARDAAMALRYLNHLDSEEIADVERAVSAVWRAEVERLRRVIQANLSDAQSALNLADKGMLRDYVDNIRYNAERALDESDPDPLATEPSPDVE